MSSVPLGVLFDVDGTLYHQRLLRVLVGACLAAAFARSPARTWRTIRIIGRYRRAQEWLRSNGTATITRESQIEIASRATGIPAAEVRRSVQYWMEELPLRLMGVCVRRRMRRLIGRWHVLGVPMGVYSDYPASEKLDRLGVARMMRCTVSSMDPDVGALKPDPRGFERAAVRLGLPASQIVYVGDREDVDADGARRAGMRAVIVGRRRPFGRHSHVMTIDALDVALTDVYRKN